MISKLRDKMQGLCNFAAKPFAVLGIHPNFVTVLGIPLAGTAAVFILQQNFLYAAIFAALAASIDLIDGSVARLQKKVTNFGNYFETMVDKFVEVMLYAPMAMFFPLHTAFVIGFSLIESYAKPRAALVIIADNRDWPAIGEHAERLLVYNAGIFAAAFYGVSIMQYFLLLIIAMTLFGSLQRMAYAKRLIKEAEKKGTILPYLKNSLGHKPLK